MFVECCFAGVWSHLINRILKSIDLSDWGQYYLLCISARELSIFAIWVLKIHVYMATYITTIPIRLTYLSTDVLYIHRIGERNIRDNDDNHKPKYNPREKSCFCEINHMNMCLYLGIWIAYYSHKFWNRGSLDVSIPKHLYWYFGN